MTPDWLLVETLGAEPVVVTQGQQTKNLVPITAFLRRNQNLMAIQSAIGETVRSGQALTSITPKSDRVIRTEVVQMTDGRIHGVHVWIGPTDVQPPERVVPGPLKWDLSNGVATDTPESLFNSGLDPNTEATHGRAFAEDLPSRDLNPDEARVLTNIINPESGQTYCNTWDVNDFQGNPITVGFVARILQETDEQTGKELLICRAMNWRSTREDTPAPATNLAQAILNSLAQPGVHRAVVEMNHWTLLKWLDDPCPFFDWRAGEADNPVVHPDEATELAIMATEFIGGPTARVLRLRANGGGWTLVHVTTHRVQVGANTFAALLSLRLPTDSERAEAETQIATDLAQS